MKIHEKIRLVGFAYEDQLCDKHKVNATTNNFFEKKKVQYGLK
jgi:hypothetical protein